MFNLQYNTDADTWKAQDIRGDFQFQSLPFGFQLYDEDVAFTVLAAPTTGEQYEAMIVLTQEGVMNDVIDRVVAPPEQLADRVQQSIQSRFNGDDWTEIRRDIRPYQQAQAGQQNLRQ